MRSFFSHHRVHRKTRLLKNPWQAALVWLAALGILLAFSQACGRGDQTRAVTVIRVYDGDTLMVLSAGKRFKVRLVGIDAPETPKRGNRGQPYSNKSRNYLKSLVQDKKLTLTTYGKDRYDRLLGELFSDGQNINLAILQEGLAEAYRGKLPLGVERYRFKEAEAIAKGPAGYLVLG